MSGGVFCRCPGIRKRPLHERRWVVTKRHYRVSAFDGYRRRDSDWSEVRCLTCNGSWRTKADYVMFLLDADRAGR